MVRLGYSVRHVSWDDAICRYANYALLNDDDMTFFTTDPCIVAVDEDNEFTSSIQAQDRIQACTTLEWTTQAIANSGNETARRAAQLFDHICNLHEDPFTQYEHPTLLKWLKEQFAVDWARLVLNNGNE